MASNECPHMATEIPTAEPPNEVTSLMQQLKAEKQLVKMFIGNDTKPYLLPTSTLINASDYFAKALDSQQTLGNNEPGVLAFPEDDEFQDAWQHLIFWIINKRLPKRPLPEDENGPTAEYIVLWVSTWVLGDKYCIPRLQNAVMIKLLRYLKRDRLPTNVEQINLMLRISPIDTPLRRLLSEEVVVLIETSGVGGLDPRDLAASDGTAGLSGSLLAAYKAYRAFGQVFPRQESSGNTRARREYLIGNEYDEHWFREKPAPKKKAKVPTRKRAMTDADSDRSVGV